MTTRLSRPEPEYDTPWGLLRAGVPADQLVCSICGQALWDGTTPYAAVCCAACRRAVGIALAAIVEGIVAEHRVPAA